ncbi:MAG TPA: hypothetical protein VGR69_00295 [Candidatus Rubrimentiphilum sp.]|nr:hypothetical protein [Candidatus Rubrimentiphilum sp.]
MESRTTGVGDADRDVQMFLVRVAGTLGELLGDNLVGLYVRGALARGRFRRERHGFELVAVVARKLPPEARDSVARTLVRLSDARPVRGDLDVTIIEEENARACDQSDTTLGAQIAEVRECGVTIVGPPAKDLFG